MRQLLLVRPEPGLSASSARARQAGLDATCCPLFRIEPMEWELPDPNDYDGLLLTSANALRCGGSKLASLKSLPAHAVGAVTADAAQAAGLKVETVGEGDLTDLLAKLPVEIRLLHLAGDDHREADTGHKIDRRIIYRSAPIEQPGLPPIDGLVVAVHSPRAGARLAELAERRDRTAIAAISAAAANATGGGWERVEVAERPNDSSLLALAASLCHTSPPK